MTNYRIGEPCNHPGCLSHVSHPCEGCGRIAGIESSYVGLSLGVAWELQEKGLVPIARETLAELLQTEVELRAPIQERLELLGAGSLSFGPLRDGYIVETS